MLTHEEQLEREIEEKRKFMEAYSNEKNELRQRLIQIATLIDTPLMDEQPDVAAFGRGEWVYCRQHCKPHQTGWCSVGIYDKIGLGVSTAEAAYTKCREWKLHIYSEND